MKFKRKCLRTIQKMLTFKISNFFGTSFPSSIYFGSFSQDSQPLGFAHTFFLTHPLSACKNIGTSFASVDKLLGPQ